MQTPDSISWFSFFSWNIPFRPLEFSVSFLHMQISQPFFSSFDNHSVTDALFCSFLEIYHSETCELVSCPRKYRNFFFFDNHWVRPGKAWMILRLNEICNWARSVEEDETQIFFFFGCVNMISSHLDHFISILSPICNFSFFKNF